LMGKTLSVLGAAPKLHCRLAPAQARKAMIDSERYEVEVGCV
jgi:hypothetical protein